MINSNELKGDLKDSASDTWHLVLSVVKRFRVFLAFLAGIAFSGTGLQTWVMGVLSVIGAWIQAAFVMAFNFLYAMAVEFGEYFMAWISGISIT